MRYTRREFGKVTLAGLPALAFLERPSFVDAVLAQAKPNSNFGGVQIGVITYSYRQMPDQTGEATLRYVVDSGINAIELMDGSTERYAGSPQPAPRGAGPGGAGGGGGRAGGGRAAIQMPGPGGANMPTCAPNEGRGARAAAPPAAPAAGAAPGAALGVDAARQGGGGGGGRGQASPEQQAFQADLKKWRTSVSMDKFKALRKMYNDAGVTIYAYKPDGMQKNMETSDEEFDYVFNVASVLGASHLTMELPPANPNGAALIKRVAAFAQKHKIYAAYHTHGQGSMTAFDEAMAMSKSNMINVDLGHYVAAGNVGGGPVPFLEKHHDRIASFHLKDRTLPEHCSLTVPFGNGDGQIKEILQTMKKNKWKFPATIELESPIPEGSDAVKEVAKSVQYARAALA